jgi:phage tail-like protein
VDELLQSFRFEVTLTRSTSRGAAPDTLGTGGFAECSGLELEADVKEYLEGGRNDGVVRRVGRVKLVPLVLKRGMFVASGGDYADSAIWKWLQGMVAGRLPIPRYGGQIKVYDPRMGRVVGRWTFDEGLPVKVTGPTLNAKTGEIAVEELHIAHEGLRLEKAAT